MDSPTSTRDPDWPRVRQVLEWALAVGPEQRDALLEATCAGEPGVLERVRRMLVHAEEEEDSLEPPLLAGELLTPASAEPERIGPWSLRQQLGGGGMGRVWLATRADGAFRGYAALKIIREELHDEHSAARFARERQVLANLAHPGIARLLDGGTTEDGLPYLVMEYVDGVPLDRWCDEQGLDVRQRVELIMQVGDAVQHAHEQLVVHRDLKPSNVLVDSRGRPHLLDFGIAKLLDPEKRVQDATMSGAGQGFMTPGYASPEQIRGDAVGPASDLYSLAVMLYRLLTGGLPHPVEGHSPSEWQESVVRETASLPSAAALSGELSEELRSEAARTLRGDLDQVVMMSLRKEPARRHPSVAAFVQDLGNWCAGRPVTARADSRLYRIKKWVLRNRAVSLLAGGLFAVLTAGLVGGFVLARDARQARDEESQQRLLAEERLAALIKGSTRMMTDLMRQVRGLPGGAEPARLIIQSAIAQLDAAAVDAESDLALRAELARGYVYLGEVLGGASSLNLGRLEEAEAALRRGQAWTAELAAEDPEKHLQVWARGEILLGQVLCDRGEVKEGLQLIQDCTATLEKQFGDGANAPDWARVRLINGYRILTVIHFRRGDEERALEAARGQLRVLETPFDQPHLEPIWRAEQAIARGHVASLRHSIEGPAATIDEVRAARDDLAESARSHGGDPSIRTPLWRAQLLAATLSMELGELDTAEQEMGEILAEIEDLDLKLLEPSSLAVVSSAHVANAGLAAAAGQFELAETRAERALEVATSIARAFPEHPFAYEIPARVRVDLAANRLQHDPDARVGPLLIEAASDLATLSPGTEDSLALASLRMELSLMEGDQAARHGDARAARTAYERGLQVYASRLRAELPSGRLQEWVELIEQALARLDQGR